MLLLLSLLRLVSDDAVSQKTLSCCVYVYLYAHVRVWENADLRTAYPKAKLNEIQTEREQRERQRQRERGERKGKKRMPIVNIIRKK